MATHLVRAAYTAEGYKGMLSNPSDRSAAIQKLFGALDMQVREVFFSTSTCEIYILCDSSGNAMKMAVAEMVVLGTGGISSVHVVDLIDAKTMVEAMTLGGKITGMYKAPNVG